MTDLLRIELNQTTDQYKLEESPREKSDPLIKRLAMSPLFWTAALGVAAITFTAVAIAMPVLLPLILPIILTLGIAIFTIQKLKKHHMRHDISLTFLPWTAKKQWHQIEPNIYLGGLPLRNFSHLEKLEKAGVKTMISMVQDWEYKKTAIIGHPASKEATEEKFTVHYLTTPDKTQVSQEDLNRGADLIHEHVTANMPIYIHCKMGKGRSASLVAAYYIKYQYMNVELAVAKMKAIRPININGIQLEALRQFEQTIISELADEYNDQVDNIFA